MDADVSCIPTCEGERVKYKPIEAGDHLMRKHLQTVSGVLCYVGEEGESPSKPTKATKAC
eukprot:579850-Prymnesium_polylepis.1